MANDLNLTLIADGQADDQWQSSNDGLTQLGNALADIYASGTGIDFSAGNVTLTSAQFRSAMVFKPSAALAAARTLTVPAVKRPFIFHNPDATYTVTLKSTDGASPEVATTIAVGPGQIFYGYTNGSSPGLFGSAIATGVAPSGDVVGPASVTDGNPAVFDGTTGKLIKQRTFTQLTASLIAVVGDAGAGGTKGLVPAPGAGDSAAGKFLKADGTFAVPAGTGVGSTATTTEVLTGTNTTNAVTPDALAALWEKGADTASAGTMSLGEGGYFHITGTTTITDIDWATAKDGRAAVLVFDGILTLTHHATTLILPGGANITTAAGDTAIFVQDATDNVKCIGYFRATGKPLIPSSSGTPFEMEVACSDEGTALTTGTAKVTFRMPCAVTLTAVRASLVTAQASGSIFTVDINEAGTTIITTKLTIDNTELTSTSAATPPVISDTALADDALMTVDIDQVGDGTAKGLKIVLIGTRT